jgi:capsid protein
MQEKKQSFFQRINSIFNPPVENTQQEKLASMHGYAPARSMQIVDRITGLNPLSGKYNADNDRNVLVSISRQLYRNNPIYKGMIDKYVSFIIGEGFSLQVHTSDENLNKKIESKWADYWKQPELTSLINGLRFQHLLCREYVSCGDVLILYTDNGKLQIIESEQITSNKKEYRNGIKTDDYNCPQSFFVTPYGTNGNLDFKKTIEVDAKKVLFITDLERPSSLRGVPHLTQSFSIIQRISDTVEQEALSFSIQARHALIVKRNSSGLNLGMLPQEISNNTDSTTVMERVKDVGSAVIFNASPNEDIQSVSRNIPSSNFDSAILTFLRLGGLPISMSAEMCTNDFSNLNYSQSKSLLQQSYLHFKIIQQNLVNQFYKKLYAMKINEFLNDVMLKDNVVIENELINEAKNNFSFLMPSIPLLDAYKEISAFSESMSLGLSTYAETCKSIHNEPTDMIEKRKAEIIKAIHTSNEIKNETGKDVPYTIFCGLPLTYNSENPIDTTIQINKNEIEDTKENEIDE